MERQREGRKGGKRVKRKEEKRQRRCKEGEKRTAAPPGGHLDIYRGTSLSVTVGGHNKHLYNVIKPNTLAMQLILCIMLLFLVRFVRKENNSNLSGFPHCSSLISI